MLAWALSQKHFGRWLGAWLVHELGTLGRGRRPAHVMFMLADHFEPLWADVDDGTGARRVERWCDDYPRLAQRFHDAHGYTPRHTFFFPLEQYRPEFLAPLAELARGGWGEVEVHLHHDADTTAGLRQALSLGVQRFAGHGLLGRAADGAPRYAFIHGDWSLANFWRDGRHCGVDDELQVLFETGCYADFTYPSAPHATQPPVVDAIYWPRGDLSRARAHEHAEAARVGRSHADRVLCVQGPLSLSRGGRLGMRIENGALTAADPATPRRARAWLGRRIHVRGRPDWLFVKVHTHGAGERQAESLLGAGGVALHRALAEVTGAVSGVRLHYVSAREMYNIALAAMRGAAGDPDAYRNLVIEPPPVMA